MFILDIPNVPPQAAPVLMHVAAVTQETPGKLNTDKLEGVIGVCVVSPTFEKMGLGKNSARFYGKPLHVQGSAQRRIDYEDMALLKAAKQASVLTLEQPKNGEIVKKGNEFIYLPNKGYVGNDKVVFLVNIDGHNIKVINYIRVVDSDVNSEEIDELYNKYCPGQTDWVISSNTTDGSSFDNTFAQNYLNSNTANTLGITVIFADLEGGALGQTTGTSITLDDNAAGNGWFIDTTPADNSEFLPTSNPYEWVAKEQFGVRPYI